MHAPDLKPVRSLRRLEPAAKIWLLSAVMTVAGIALGQVGSDWWGHQHLPVHLTWWMLAPAFAASEIFVVHYQLRHEQYSFTLSELPLALGLYFSTWPAIVAARLIGGGLALRFHRRQTRVKM